MELEFLEKEGNIATSNPILVVDIVFKMRNLDITGTR